VSLDGGQVRAGGQDRGELAARAAGQIVRVAHNPGGDLAGLGRLRCRAGRDDAEAPRGEVVADKGVAAGVSAVADLPPQLGRIRAAFVPPLVQVRRVLIEQAGALAAPVVDQQLARVGGAGEPADGVARQAQLDGDHR